MNVPELPDSWVAAIVILMAAAFVIASIYWQWP